MAAKVGIPRIIQPEDRRLITTMNTSITTLTPSVMEEVDALFTEWDNPHSPGCALGIIRDGELIYARGYGMANLDYDIPITPRSVFRIASTSKQFTATCIALMIEMGEISLEDDIRKFLPELPDLEARVTVQHLLHHTSGWRDYIELMELRGIGDDDFYTDEDVLEILSRQKQLNFKPGDDFLYSNTGYYLLGIIVQRVSGVSLRRYAQENIFKPLGMGNTHFHDDHTEVVKELAVGYAPREDGGYRICMTVLDIVGDGGIFTTVEDLYLWDQNFYANKLGKGKADLLQMLHRTGVKNSGEALEYAFGLEVKDYKGLRMVCHSGGFIGYRAEMIRFPEQHFSVICLANLSTIEPSRLARQVADLCLADLLHGKAGMLETDFDGPNEIPERELLDKAGLYWSPSEGVILEISVEGGKMVGETAGTRIEFEAMYPGRFHSLDAPYKVELRFERGRTNSHWQLYLTVEDEVPIILAWIEATKPTLEQLLEYTGCFYSQELDVTYQIVLVDEGLQLEHRNAPSGVLKPAMSDMFWIDGRIFRFIRAVDEHIDGQITGFEVSSGRVKDIYFQRTS